MDAWTVFAKDVRQRLRDRTGILVAVVVPLLISLLVGAAFGGNEEGLHLRIGVVDLDSSPESHALVDFFSREWLSPLTELVPQPGVATAERALANLDVDAVIMMQAGYGAAVATGKPPPLEVVGRGGGTKKLLLIVGVILLLAVGGFAAAYFTGLIDPVIAWITGGEDKEEDQAESEGDAVFFPLEEVIVNLNTGGRQSTFLKIKISLELADAVDIPRIETVMPRIMDNFQVYLRELRIEDLKGAAGMYRLREELLTRVNVAAAPTKINDVLFKEMLVQ